jgi:hypothetical protein
MTTPLIKDLDKTVAALEGVTFFRNFAKLTFNRHVEAVYHQNIDSHIEARRALLITDKDTQISIANKQLLFFFSLQKFTQQTTEKISFAKGTAAGDPNMIRMKVQLSPSLLYKKDGTPVGKRYISVPHIDESKLGNLNNFTFTHGIVTRLYCFADRKQIKVEAISETEANRVINELLKLVETKWLLGSSESHAYTGNPPKDIKLPDLYNVTSKCHELHIYYPNSRAITIFV